MRIVTLLPSATDLVLALGQGDNLVGISHSCDGPALLDGLPRLTSTSVPQGDSQVIDDYVRDHLETHSALYQLDLEGLEAAKPDVVLSQGLCEVCAVATGDVVEAVQGLSSRPQLVDLNPFRLEDIFDDLAKLGEVLGCADHAAAVVQTLKLRVQRVAAITKDLPRRRVAFLEWLMPLFNGGHWNPELVQLAGGEDLTGSLGQPSSTLSWEQLEAADAELLLVACCGYRVPRTREDLEALGREARWNQLRAVRDGQVFMADGQAYFARPGPSVVEALERLAATLHPDHFSAEPFERFAGAGAIAT
ncbi:MAG: cobalamin-binding protein [Pseudomonadota bacterium]